MKIIIVIIFSLNFCITGAMDSIAVKEQRRMLKDFTFYRCLEHSSICDNPMDISGSEIVELSDYSFDVFNKIDSIAKEYILKYNYKTKQTDKNMLLKYCLDFYNSKNLDSIINTFDYELIKNFQFNEELKK